MIQVLDKNGNTSTDYGKLIVLDKYGDVKVVPGSLGTVTYVAALTLGTAGTDLSSTVANPTTTPVITLNVPTASALNRGVLSSADWSTFNTVTNKVPYTGANANVDLGNYTLTTLGLSLSGNQSAAAWLTDGIRIKSTASTFTDTTSTGVVLTGYTDVFNSGTIAATSVTEFATYYGSYFKDPVAGSNVTFRNKFAAGADSFNVNGTFSNYNSLLFDMGYITNSDIRGYGTDYITDKTLNNIVIGSNGTASNGGVRITTAGSFDVNLLGTWYPVSANIILVEDTSAPTFAGFVYESKPVGYTQYIEVMTGSSVFNRGNNGYPITNAWKTSMGANPVPPIIGGRVI